MNKEKVIPTISEEINERIDIIEDEVSKQSGVLKK